MSGSQHAFVRCVPLACWATYAPLGLKYTAWLILLGLALLEVQRRRLWPALLQVPGVWALLSLLGLLLLSALWSNATWATVGTHLWLYSLPLGVLPLVVVCPASVARRAIEHFVVVSGCVGALVFIHSQGALGSHWLWSSSVTSTGNQRIITSLLLALGVGLALWLAAQPQPAWRRAVWLGAGLLALLGLVSQDRRTGLLMLPIVLLAWSLVVQRGAFARVLMLAVLALASLGIWTASGAVRERFYEGAAELQSYVSSDAVPTSWGQRLRMFELTAQMVGERPLTGHGVGSWQGQWDQRVTTGTPVAANSSPHNEYLLLAMQAGVGAALLLAAWLGSLMGASARAGSLGVPALMVWLSLALAGLANVVLRDAKFALPLLLLAALTTAQFRAHPVPGER